MSYSYYITPENFNTALANGICENTLIKRVRTHGWDIERAITTKPERGKWSKWIEIAKGNGISPSVFYTRITRDRMSPEVAATASVLSPQENAKRGYESKRKYPKEYEGMALENGISYDSFCYRMRKGWDPIEAATKPMRGKHDPPGNKNVTVRF